MKENTMLVYIDDLEPVIKKLAPEQAVMLITKMMDYKRDGIDEDCGDQMVEMAFLMFKGQIDRFSRKYEEVSKKRREAANRKWEALHANDANASEDSSDSDDMQMHANDANADFASNDMQMHANDANASKCMQKMQMHDLHYDPDPDPDPDPDKGLKKESVRERAADTADRTRRHQDKSAQRTGYGTYQNVYLSQAEYAIFKAERSDAEDLIDSMSEYLKAHGKRYKDCLAALRNWGRRDDEKRGSPRPREKISSANAEIIRLMEGS